MNEIISIQKIAGGDALFNYPSGIRLNHDKSTLYITDMKNHRVCWIKENASTGNLTDVVRGDENCSSLGLPLAIWVTKQETLFVADAQYNKIFYKIQQNDYWSPVKVKQGYSLNVPGGVAVDDDGNIYTNDFLNNRIIQVTPNGDVKVLLQSEGNISKIYGIFYYCNRLYYTNTGNARICYIDLNDGQNYIVNPQIATKGLSAPIALALNEEGNIYVCEQRSIYFINVIENTLSLITDRDIWKEQMIKYNIKDKMCYAGALTIGHKGELYCVDTIKGCVYKIILNFTSEVSN